MASPIPVIVQQVVSALQQAQTQPTYPPTTLSLPAIATAEILGQDPVLRRQLGPTGVGVVNAWINRARAVRRYIIIRGDGQTGQTGTALPIAPELMVVNAFSQPVVGENVTFVPTVGGGAVAIGAAVPTDVRGIASPGLWTLGPAGGLNLLEARIGGRRRAIFRAVAVGVRVSIARGNNQVGAAGTVLPVRPAVLVTDPYGQPVQGIAITFAVTAGGGALAGAAVRISGPDGIAEAGDWTLGGAAGANRVTASLGGVVEGTFNATAT